jgi:cytosolic phospholipase A2
MLKKHFPGLHHRDRDEIGEKAVESHPSISGKLGHIWENHVKPAFPEALADLSITKNAIETDLTVRKDIHNVNLFPEIEKVAEVRRGLDLAPEEIAFLTKRKEHVRDHFAKYIGVDPAEVHPDDVPVVGFGGSGGGFRAMISCLGYCEEMKSTGLWDLLTYYAGVSGSCWALAAYYTFGKASWKRLIEHSKKCLSPYHPLSGEAIRKVLTVPDGLYVTLGPLVEKHRSGLHIVAMDLYSVFTTGYLFLHDDPNTQHSATGQETGEEIAGHHHSWYKWSSAQKHIESGAEPLPILTAIRHERPWKDWVDEENPFKEPDHTLEEHSGAQDAWFQWFEMTPFEIGSDELEAWVPTWGFGRPFSEGKSTMQLPEQSLALLLGLCTSAPAGPLSSYLSTIERNLPQNFLGNAIQDLAKGVSRLWGKEGTEKFQDHHPLHACNEHNFLYHLTPLPRGENRPPGLENSPRIHLIDSGMDNNCPTYVLLHPSRSVDVIINLDASSDVQKDTFPERVDQIGSRRGLKFVKRHDIKAGTNPSDPDRFKGLYAQIYDGTLCKRPEKVKDSYGNIVTNPPAPISRTECTMVYMPLLPNERAVPGYDPSTAKFSGSYNLVWTPEQVEMLVKVSTQNFRDGEETVRTALREAWERKRAKREGRGPAAAAAAAAAGAVGGA